MRIRKIYLLLFCVMIFFNYCNHSENPSKITKNTGLHFKMDKKWPALPNEFKLGNPTGIGIDTNEHIFVFERAGREWPLIGAMPKTFIAANTILMLDKDSGHILKLFSAF